MQNASPPNTAGSGLHYMLPAPIESAPPNWDYHADLSRISNSGVKEMLKTPAHYYQAYLAPKTEARKETEALIFGQILHCLVYEPLDFPNRFYLMPKISKTTAAGKSAVDEAQKLASINNKRLIFREEYELARQMAEVIRNHPFMREVMSQGMGERTILFNDPLTEAPCKLRLDWWSESTGLIIDLKTCEDASKAGFAYSVKKYKYFIQDPFYIDGCQASGELYPEGMVFFAIEKKPPYLCKPYFIPDEARQYGRQQINQALTTYMECRRSGSWPGYSIIPEEIPFYIPK